MSKFKPTKIIIHCSDSTWGNADEIDKWHKERGWDGIGYHFVILNGSPDGRRIDTSLNGYIENGRPLTKQGAHCKGHNSDSIGICLIGVYDFTTAQYSSLKELCENLMGEYNISSDDIMGHYEYSTKTCPNFNVDDFVRNLIVADSPSELEFPLDMSSDIVTDEEALDALYALKRFFKQ